MNKCFSDILKKLFNAIDYKSNIKYTKAYVNYNIHLLFFFLHDSSVSIGITDSLQIFFT